MEGWLMTSKRYNKRDTSNVELYTKNYDYTYWAYYIQMLA
jgi:hypothetical protein